MEFGVLNAEKTSLQERKVYIPDEHLHPFDKDNNQKITDRIIEIDSRIGILEKEIQKLEFDIKAIMTSRDEK